MKKIATLAHIIVLGLLLSAHGSGQKTANDAFWNRNDFWETPALKTPYKESLSEDERIAGLSKFWSEAKYNFINFDLVPGLDWDRTYLEFLPKARAARTTLEYFRVLQAFAAKLKDGHTLLLPPAELVDSVNARPNIVTALIEDKVIVTSVLDASLMSNGIVAGIEVTAIDGKPVKQYAVENVLPYSSDSTQQASDLSVYSRWLLSGSSRRPLDITFRNANGDIFTKTLPRIPWDEWRKAAPGHDPFEMQLLDGNIMLIRLNTFTNSKPSEEFEKNFGAIANTDAIVLDLRENGGGNDSVGARILSFLTEKGFLTPPWQTREYHPAFRAWGNEDKLYSEGPEVYKKEVSATYAKPVIVLTGARTGSAAEDFVVAFRAAKRGLIVGEPTSGSTGQPLLISLPGGILAGICTKYDYAPDGTPFVGVGVMPDIVVRRSVRDVREGNDAALKRALDELRKSK